MMQRLPAPVATHTCWPAAWPALLHGPPARKAFFPCILPSRTVQTEKLFKIILTRCFQPSFCSRTLCSKRYFILRTPRTNLYEGRGHFRQREGACGSSPLALNHLPRWPRNTATDPCSPKECDSRATDLLHMSVLSQVARPGPRRKKALAQAALLEGNRVRSKLQVSLATEEASVPSVPSVPAC